MFVMSSICHLLLMVMFCVFCPIVQLNGQYGQDMRWSLLCTTKTLNIQNDFGFSFKCFICGGHF